MRVVRTFWRDERGATALEYCLIAAFISIALVAGATIIGTRLGVTFTKVGTGLP